MTQLDFNRFDKFFETSSDCQFYVSQCDDGAFRYVRVNQAARSVAGGISEDEIIGLTPIEALGEEYGYTVEHNVKIAFETGRTYHFRGPIGRDDRGPTYDAFYYPMFDETGRLCGVLGSARNISEICRLNEQLLHAEKLEALGQIAGTVAHDFDNIIGSFQALLCLLENSNLSEKRRAVVLREGHHSLENGKALTQRLSQFLRREKISPTQHDIRRLIDDCAPMLRHILGKHVLVTTEFDQGLWNAYCDASEFEIAMINLATNARDAMGKGGKITISAKNRARTVEDPESYPPYFVDVTFQDNGHGMSEETIAHAIEPFFTTKERGNGTGLGMSSIARFVKSAGGEIAIYSELGRGTSVSLLLPRDPPWEVFGSPLKH